MHALRFFPSVSLGYWGKFFGWPVPSLAKAVRAGGVSAFGRWSGLDRRRLAPARWFPPGTGRERGGVLRTLRVVGAFPVPRGAAPRGPACPAGSPFLPRNEEKEGRGSAPGPRVFMAARCHSLVFGAVVFGTVEGLFPPVC